MWGWLRYFELQAKVRTGLSTSVVTWATVAAMCAAVTIALVIVAIAIWLADRYGPLTAIVMLGGFFLCVTIMALIACQFAYRQTVARAKQALAVRSSAPWLNPGNLAVGMQIGRAIGWRRIVPLIAVGVIAAGISKEWFSHATPADDDSAEAERDAT